MEFAIWKFKTKETIVIPCHELSTQEIGCWDRVSLIGTEEGQGNVLCGSATIICSQYGKPLVAKIDGKITFEQRPFQPLIEVKLDRDCETYNIEIIWHHFTKALAYVTRTIFKHSLMGQYAVYNTIPSVFRSAIRAAIEKSFCVGCNHDHYAERNPNIIAKEKSSWN